MPSRLRHVHDDPWSQRSYPVLVVGVMDQAHMRTHDGAVPPSPFLESRTLMWPALARTRRRLLGTPPVTHLDPLDDDVPPVGPEDCVIAIGRPEVQRLADALQTLLGPDAERPDTPARLEVALGIAVQRLGGGGVPHVTRRPPGLYTPEAWQVHLTAVRPAVSEAIRGAIRTGGFA